MAHAEISETLNVDREKLFLAVTQYEAYPQFVDGCKAVQITREGDSKARVSYDISMMKDIRYTLEHNEDRAAGVVTWKLVESDFLKKNEGRWTMVDAGGGKTRVDYSIEIDFKIPVPGFVLNKLIKSSLPAMLKSFEKRARSL